LYKIKFGTDGWRGVISEDFTFENVRRVANAIADYYNQHKFGKPKIAVGYDTRFLSETYAELVAQALANNGIKVILSDRAIPTPALSLAVKLKKLDAGVMITASHNPAKYNGIKIKTASGAAASPEVTQEIEKLLKQTSAKGQKNKKADKINKFNLSKGYVDFLRSYIRLSLLKRAKFHLLVDVMFGSGSGFLADVLSGTGIKIDFMRSQINPSFDGIRPEPVLENLGLTVDKLKEGSYDLGLVLDGDADRVAAFDGYGNFIHSQKILGLLILHLVLNRKMTGGVVKTVAGTTLIDKIIDYLGLKLYETSVGFKYISELMEKEDILIGGEEAGGIGVKGYIPERDGSLSGLLLLEMMVYQNKPMFKILNDMEKKFGRYYYLRDAVNLRKLSPNIVNNLSSSIKRLESKKDLLGKGIVQVKDFDGLKLICEDESWLMLRISGTEPLVRVYAEAKSLLRSRKLLNFGKGLISKYAL